MLLLILLWLLLSLVVAVFGINRKFGFWGYFFASIVLTPIIGLLLVLVSDPRKKPRRRRM